MPTAPPLAIFGSLNIVEVLVVAAAALMIFGSRLPEVALRAVAHVMRARRAVSKMWRETGLEEELRRVRRDVELNLPRDTDFDVRPKRQAPARGAPRLDPASDAEDPDAGRAGGGVDAGVELRPAEGTIAAGEWSSDGETSDEPTPAADGGSPPGDGRDASTELDPDADRREPDGSSGAGV